MGPEAEVIEALHQFGALLVAKDPAIIEEFAPDADALLVGSEADEVASGPGEIAEIFRAILSQPFTISFEWRETRASVAGDQAWLFASGEVVLRADGTERRSPYRLTGVFQRRGGKWLWKHFHGSEPAHR
jgi:ketosteroid isomerase-like protein